jgi:ATP-dependent protease ClpP protease subunit/ribosomal protein S27E
MGAKGIFQSIVESQPTTTLQQMRETRVALIRQVEALRQRPLAAYVTSLSPLPRVTAYISHEDIVPFSEILDSVEGDKVDVLLESPGGLSEVSVELRAILRKRFSEVGFIIPHVAMSAATILVMSGDEILMDHRSSLGAIDPQFVGNDGRPQPAQAILTGIETIKKSIQENNGVMNPVYLPILRNIDPGKLQNAIDASELSKRIVTESLTNYKFKNWIKHENSGKPVTQAEREQTARDIAVELCKHERWLSHSHPIKMEELRRMGLQITDYGEQPELQKAIWSLWVHYHHFLSSTNTYKAFETATVDFAKIAAPIMETMRIPFPTLPAPVPMGAPGVPGPRAVPFGHAITDVICQKCGALYKIQANFGQGQASEQGTEPFPKDCMLTCRKCGTIINLSGLKMQIEAKVRQNLVL